MTRRCDSFFAIDWDGIVVAAARRLFAGGVLVELMHLCVHEARQPQAGTLEHPTSHKIDTDRRQLVKSLVVGMCIFLG
ncbi:hypothetical protein TRAPUB_279 [Trametes pubescens]|uniref:Uncharacterized protein n=1 Tax=Trametes pubescens TaxID=154538 RepID=A0A1M2VMQ7_TRAPU|nr:hypothetical protein TRAPUB_279 [Trametes pubescens]